MFGVGITGAGALIGGVVSIASPCSAMLLPAFFAYAYASRRQILLHTLVLFIGLLTTMLPLGALAGSLGAVLLQNRSTFIAVMALLVMVLGLMQAINITIPPTLKPYLAKSSLKPEPASKGTSKFTRAKTGGNKKANLKTGIKLDVKLDAQTAASTHKAMAARLASIEKSSENLVLSQDTRMRNSTILPAPLAATLSASGERKSGSESAGGSESASKNENTSKNESLLLSSPASPGQISLSTRSARPSRQETKTKTDTGVSAEVAQMAAKKRTFFSVYLLGTVFGVSSVCAGPILGSVLAVAALEQNYLRGAFLLGLYALGMVIPTLVLAIVWDLADLGNRRWMRPIGVKIGPIHTTVTNLVAGTIFFALGALLFWYRDSLEGIGIFSAQTQANLEDVVKNATSGVSDTLILLVLILVVILVAFGVYKLKKRRQRSALKP